MGQEEHQQVEFAVGQVHRAPGQCDRPRRGRHAQFADREFGRRGRRQPGRAAQHRPHTQGQLARAERFGQVVVGAGLQPRDAVVLLAERGQQDHRQPVITVFAQLAAQRQPVGPGHHHVEHRDVELLGLQQPQRLRAVVRDGHVEPVTFEVAADDVADDGVVVGDQDTGHSL